MLNLLFLFILFFGYISIIYIAISSWHEVIKKFDFVDLIFALLATALTLLPVPYLIDILQSAK